MGHGFKGQISAEMIIILAVLLGVVFLIAMKMRETASSASVAIQDSSTGTFAEINKTLYVGRSCENDLGCGGLKCTLNRCA